MKIQADRIDLTDGFISSDTKSFGNAGAVRITVGDLRVGGDFQNVTNFDGGSLTVTGTRTALVQ